MKLLQHKHQVLMAQGPPTKAPVQLGEQEFGRIEVDFASILALCPLPGEEEG